MKKEYISKSERDTLNFAFKLGTNALKGDVFALSGELGAGKTIIAKGIAKGLGINEDITSPTFTLFEEYISSVPLYHFDLYRIEEDDEFEQLSFEEYWEGNGVSVIEWAEKASNRLPERAVRITISYMQGTRRKLVIEYPDDRRIDRD